MVIVPILPRRGKYSVIPSPDGKPVSGLFAEWTVDVENPSNIRQLVSFRIDTGAECSVMSLKRAERLGLLRDDDGIVLLSTRTAGAASKRSTVRIGRLVAHIPILRIDPFDWPIMFHPDWSVSTPPLLGLAGVIADLTMLFDGNRTDASEFGSVTITLRS
jgi:aspartyl protease